MGILAQMVKNPPVMQETLVQSLGQEVPWEKGMATHSSVLAWKIPWTEEPGGLQPMGKTSTHSGLAGSALRDSGSFLIPHLHAHYTTKHIRPRTARNTPQGKNSTSTSKGNPQDTMVGASEAFCHFVRYILYQNTTIWGRESFFAGYKGS